MQKLASKARKGPGVQAFLVHQSTSEPSEFVFYEAFSDEDAFEAHQKTAHFEALIADEAWPKLAERERGQWR